ncbi:MAG: cation:proton antiporter [Chloroflexi bacterium]|nr:cation:proton antiporter [Chloroflexota bacterium]
MLAAIGAAGDGDAGLVRDFAIIMAVAGGALLLFRQFKQPPVLGYLVAGVIIGPFTLPDPPVKNVETIRLLADLGLVLLLFGVGLELGWQRIRGIGGTVIMIALVEFTVMFALGYELAILMGWGNIEGIFLGASISVSSTAILMKMLRDTDRLLTMRGRLIVGILVVEDFIAVIMLTVLSGLATTGTANIRDIGFLVGKLGIFGVAALGFGGIFAPRLIRWVSRFHSDEAMLITGLALCFGLALAGQQLGLSAAAGAFLMGAVLGDSDHSEEMGRVMSPVRDMFAALFFVSIGMLIDISLAVDYLVPSLIVAAVFIVGKIVADSAGTLLAGYGGRTSLGVGMGMPQMGEFSLAMAKVGADFGAVGGFMYPVITITTAVTAVLYPTIFRSVDRVTDFLERRSPRMLKQYGESLVLSLAALHSAFSFTTPRARRIQRSGKLIFLNLAIIIVIIGFGTGALRFTSELSGLLRLSESLLGLVVGVSVLGLCVPPALAIWRSLRRLSDEIAGYVFPGTRGLPIPMSGNTVRVVVRDSILILLLAVPGIWSIPFISQLLSLGNVSTPLPILLMLGLAAGLAWAGFQIHGVLENAFSLTLLGAEHDSGSAEQGRTQAGGADDTSGDGQTPAGHSGDDATAAHESVEE